MTTFEWFLLIVVVIAVPLIVAVVVTLWTLEQARQRNRRNRGDGTPTEPVKRNATRSTGTVSERDRAAGDPVPDNAESPTSQPASPRETGQSV